MKTAIFSILDTSAFGGAEQYMFSHLRFLANSGYHVILATNNKKVKEIMLSRLTEKEKKIFEIIHAPYRLDAIGNWKGLVKFFLAAPKAEVWAYNTMKQLSKTYDKVICLWPGYSDRSIFSPIAKHFHFPLIWIEFGTLEPIYARNWGFPKPLFQLPSPLARHLVTSSLYTKKSIVKNSRFTNNDVTIIYPGTQQFTQKQLAVYAEKATRWQKDRGFMKKKIFTLMGRVAHENEMDMVINAYSQFLKNFRIKDTLLQIIGDGPQKKELEDLVKKLGIEKNVLFHGFVSDEEKLIYLAASTVFVFPRAWVLDGFGMTTIEAMAMAIPVLTTNFGPQIEIVTDGKDGIRYKPHDSRDLAKHMYEVIKMNSQKRKKMGLKGYERVTQFSEEISHKKMLEIIKTYGD